MIRASPQPQKTYLSRSRCGHLWQQDTSIFITKDEIFSNINYVKRITSRYDEIMIGALGLVRLLRSIKRHSSTIWPDLKKLTTLFWETMIFHTIGPLSRIISISLRILKKIYFVYKIYILYRCLIAVNITQIVRMCTWVGGSLSKNWPRLFKHFCLIGTRLITFYKELWSKIKIIIPRQLYTTRCLTNSIGIEMKFVQIE